MMKRESTYPESAHPSRLRAQLLHLYQRLLKHFGPRRWWPAEHAWEMMVGAILTQNTNWSNVEKALQNLKAAKALSVRAIAAMPLRRLESLIRPSGFFRQKAQRLQAFARYLQAHPEFHRQLAPSPRLRHPSPYVGRGAGGEGETRVNLLRKKLLSLPGIGPETADSMLLYAGKYPVFVVDAYTRRIGQRVGLFRFNDYNQVQGFFERGLPKKPALYNEYHALLVSLAKTYCKKRKPLCEQCPLNRECAYNSSRHPRVTLAGIQRR